MAGVALPVFDDVELVRDVRARGGVELGTAAASEREEEVEVEATPTGEPRPVFNLLFT